MNVLEIAGVIDHTILKPDAQWFEVKEVCDQAEAYGFASACVNSGWVPHCVARLQELRSSIPVASVIGFPLGAMPTEVKVFEATWALNCGARELDTVINVGKLMEGSVDYVRDEILEIVKLAHARGAIVKVILCTDFLTLDLIRLACTICLEVGADFVKTCTGFGPGGATEEVVRLMKEVVGDKAGVKASGKIKTLPDFIKMKAAGATRIGTSSGIIIVKAALAA